MSSYPAETTFYQAVAAAEATRQAAYGAALTTWLGAYTAANKQTYLTAIAAADVAYFTAVNAARNTAGGVAGPPYGTLKTVGDIGPIGWPGSGAIWSGI